VRSAGISDKDFYLPINLRIFKYYDETFKVYSRLAYGERPNELNENPLQNEGVEQGHCGGLAGGCIQTEGYNDQGYALSGIDLTDETKVGPAVSHQFYQQVLIPACDKISAATASDLVLKACPTNADCVGSPDAGLDCSDTTVETKMQGPDVKACPTSYSGTNPNYCGFYGGNPGGSQSTFTMNFKLIDDNPAYRIDPSEPVVFSWGVSLQHYP
jgi:hypothetical protein